MNIRGLPFFLGQGGYEYSWWRGRGTRLFEIFWKILLLPHQKSYTNKSTIYAILWFFCFPINDKEASNISEHVNGSHGWKIRGQGLFNPIASNLIIKIWPTNNYFSSKVHVMNYYLFTIHTIIYFSNIHGPIPNILLNRFVLETSENKLFFTIFIHHTVQARLN